MRGDAEGAGSGDEALRVLGLVGTNRDASGTRLLPLVEHQQGGVAFRMAVRLRGHRGGDQAVAVLHQRMAQIRQPGLLAVALLVQPRLRIGGRLMGFGRPLLSMEVRPPPSLEPSFLRKLFCDAQAWIRVPSTVKCSSLMKRFASWFISAKNRWATFDVNRRSRLFENTAWFHTASFMPSPTNQRKSRLSSSCSTHCRSERTE